MVLVHVGPVVVQTTGQTTTTRMLAVLADTAVTGTDVTTVLSRLSESGLLGHPSSARERVILVLSGDGDENVQA